MSRLRRCSTRCAAPLTLLSSNPALEIFTALFLVGAALFAAGTWLTRRQLPQTAAPPATAITWTQAVSGTDSLPWELRLDLIERLAIVGQPWCADMLTLALAEETDAVVLDAAERALLVIQARS